MVALSAVEATDSVTSALLARRCGPPSFRKRAPSPSTGLTVLLSTILSLRLMFEIRPRVPTTSESVVFRCAEAPLAIMELLGTITVFMGLFASRLSARVVECVGEQPPLTLVPPTTTPRWLIRLLFMLAWCIPLIVAKQWWMTLTPEVLW